MNTRNFELWLGLASVLVVANTDGSNGLPSSVVADEFGSPGTLRTMFVFGSSTWRYGV